MAYVDGELPSAEARQVLEHLDACSGCAARSRNLERDRRRTGQALRVLDTPPPSQRVRRALSTVLDGARRDAPRETAADVRRPAGPEAPPSLRSASGSRRSGWARRSRLAQAAALVLLLAGGAAALVPGSPLRRWVETWTGSEAEAPALTGEAVTEPSPEAGMVVEPAEGRVRVSVSGLAAGGELRVTVVDRDRAAVYAPGASFRSGPGWVEARVGSGPVRVELPADVVEASLEVDGRRYLTMRRGNLEVAVPAAERSETELRFRID